MDKASMGVAGTLIPLLSIIVPSYNEAERLPVTIERIVAFSKNAEFPVEVIIVDNASRDATKDIITDYASRYPFITYQHEAVQGKGAAVKTGILAAKGELLLISDADLAVPIEEVVKFIPYFQECDIVIGSREAEGAIRYDEPLHRHLMGRVFNFIVRSLLLPGIRDTQCGFKCFRHNAARDLFSANTIDGWSFDAEILYIARLRGYRIAEVPIKWYYGGKSKVNPARDSWNMLREVLTIWKNGRKGLYRTEP